MALTLTPTPYQTVLDSDGNPVSGALINTYLAGTTTAAATYTTSTGDVANANPIVADSAGRFVAYLSAGLSYKYVVTTAGGDAIDTQDNILAVPGSSVNLDITGTAGEAIAAGEVVYISATGDASGTAGLWYLADASNAYQSTTAIEIGIAVSAIAINTSGTIRLAGEATTATSVVVGTKYYVSETAGAITSTAPTLSRLVGIAQTTSTLILNANPLTLPLIVSQGGTGKSALTAYGVLLGGTTTTAVVQSITPAAAGQLLKSGGTGAVAAWTDDPSVATLTLSTPLAVGSGGTGLNTLTSASVIIGAGTSDVTFVAPSTSGNVLKSTGSVWESAAASNSTPYLAAAVGSNILTLSVVSAAGAAPSSGSPVDVTFRNITLATGAPTTISLTAATTVAIPDTALMGTTNDIPFRLWIVAFNDGGTVRLAAINCATTASVYPLAGWGIASATAVSTGADSAQVFYGSAGVTAKSYTVLGYVTYESGLSTAGTWSAVPTRVQSFDESVRLPGTPLNHVYARDTTGTTSSSNTDVDTGLTATITPSSAANLVLASAIHNGVQKNTGDTAAQLSLLSGGSIVVVWTLAQGRTSSTVTVTGTTGIDYLDAPGTASSRVYKTQLRSQSNIAAVGVNNGGASSTMTLTEIMA